MFLRKIIRNILALTPLRSSMFYLYQYNFTPDQLCYMIKCINETKNIAGSIVEIGCASGHTTIFLNKYLDIAGIEKKYICIDTFHGFTKEDIDYEVNKRNKKRNYYSGFSENNIKWFYHTLNINNVKRVIVEKADIKKFNFSKDEKISFCLIDVDLYKPTKSALKKVYELLQPGGIILVDDCENISNRFDGAYQAYHEFIFELGIKPEIKHFKLGIIKAPLTMSSKKNISKL